MVVITLKVHGTSGIGYITAEQKVVEVLTFK